MSSSRILSVSLAALLLVGGVNVASYAVNGQSTAARPRQPRDPHDDAAQHRYRARRSSCAPGPERHRSPSPRRQRVAAPERRPGRRHRGRRPGDPGLHLRHGRRRRGHHGDQAVPGPARTLDYLVRYVGRRRSCRRPASRLGCHFECRSCRPGGRGAMTEAERDSREHAATTGPYLHAQRLGRGRRPVGGRRSPAPAPAPSTCSAGPRPPSSGSTCSQVQRAVTTAP